MLIPASGEGGTVEGFNHSSFIAPLTLSILLLVFFFVWEAKIEEQNAMMPGKIWRKPNMILLAIAA